MIGAGDLNKQITIYNRTLVDDGRETTEVFAVSGETRAKIMYLSDGEKFSAGAIQHNISMRFIIRKRSITVNDQIEYNSERFNIVGIKELGNMFLEITAGKVK